MKVSGTIIQIDKTKINPLRKIAQDVVANEFGTPSLVAVIEAMQNSLSQEEDGVALAAPQIAISKRIFVVSPKAYDEEAKLKPLIFINPKIVKVSKKTKSMQEGCLSVRWIYGTTERHIAVTVQAQDINGKKFSYGASGLIAHIFQHEIDHLDGVLFIDHGYDFEEYTSEEEYKERMKKSN
jgi:peptide deformylase